MAILKAELLVSVNNALEREETDIDSQIKRVLFKISNSDNFLAAIKSSDTIDSDNVVVDVPDLIKKILNIRLFDATNSLFTNYLTEITYEEYTSTRFSQALNTSLEYAILNKQIYFTPTPATEFEVHIAYSKIHNDDPDNIEFDDRFRNVLESGAITEVAYKYGLKEQIAIWGPRYGDDLDGISRYAQSPVTKTVWHRF